MMHTTLEPISGLLSKLAHSCYTVKPCHFRLLECDKIAILNTSENFTLPIKGLINTSRTLGKCGIKTQQNFYITESENKNAEK